MFLIKNLKYIIIIKSLRKNGNTLKVIKIFFNENVLKKKSWR